MFLWLLPAGHTLKVTAREKPLIKVTWSHDFLALTLRLLFTSDICLLVSCWHKFFFFFPPGVFFPVMLLETKFVQRPTYIKETGIRNV